jgi:hypothetical protein
MRQGAPATHARASVTREKTGGRACVCIGASALRRTGGSVPSPTQACTALATAAASAADSGERGTAVVSPPPSICAPDSAARRRSGARSVPAGEPCAAPSPPPSSAAASDAAAAASAARSRSPARKALMRRCRRRCSRDGVKRAASRRMVNCGQQVRSMFGCAARCSAQDSVRRSTQSGFHAWQQRLLWRARAARAAQPRVRAARTLYSQQPERRQPRSTSSARAAAAHAAERSQGAQDAVHSCT